MASLSIRPWYKGTKTTHRRRPRNEHGGDACSRLPSGCPRRRSTISVYLKSSLNRNLTNTPKPQLEATAGTAMEECIQRILGDVDGAIDWVIQGKDEHPNRLDIIRESSNRGRSSRGGRGGRGDFASRVEQPSPNQFSSAGNSTFGHQANQSPFGQPARQGSPFGQPAFGQAPFSQTSTL